MTNKGENKKAKAISVPRVMQINRKQNFWTIRTSAGPHSKQNSIPIGIIVRDFIKIVKTLKEAKHLLNNGEVKINGVIRRKHQFPVGLFDVVSIPKQKLFYRVMLDLKERLVIVPLQEEGKEKISKVKRKVMTGKGIQITTDDARTYFGIKANVGDSLKISLPAGKVEEVLEFKEGMTGYLTKGAHCSKIAKIKQIVKATQRRDTLAKLKTGREEFETTAENVFVVGKDKPVLEGLKEE
jgi:small subunit ribosomal protein S4e